MLNEAFILYHVKCADGLMTHFSIQYISVLAIQYICIECSLAVADVLNSEW